MRRIRACETACAGLAFVLESTPRLSSTTEVYRTNREHARTSRHHPAHPSPTFALRVSVLDMGSRGHLHRRGDRAAGHSPAHVVAAGLLRLRGSDPQES